MDLDDSKQVKFRNYKPQTHFLDGLYSIEKAEPETITAHVKDKIDLLSQEETSATGNKYKIDSRMFEPKKIDWDLKRRIEKRMERLDRETRRVIDRHIKNQRNKAR